MALRNVMGIIGDVLSFFLFLSPAPTFCDIYRKGEVQQYSSATYIATFVNCSVWALYGTPLVNPDDILITIISGIGAGIELIFIALYLWFSTVPRRKWVLKMLFGSVFLVGLVAIVVLISVQTNENRARGIGILGGVTGACMYGAPLLSMGLVIQMESVEYMSLTVSLFSLLNSTCWTVYASHPLDLYVAVPNIVGIVLAIGQLFLYAKYYQNTQRILEERAAVPEAGP